jgi:molybdopterin-guanine dinucleotide biosynthesis protein A
MNCYILAGGEDNPKDDFLKIGDISRLEKSYRSYAAVFDKVKIVIKKDQAKEKYLNYPHICDELDKKSAAAGVEAALRDANSEAVFIGSTDINEFPPKLLYELIKSYNGEAFLGYIDKTNKHQPLFGIYNKGLGSKISVSGDKKIDISEFGDDNIKLLNLPENIDAACIGL